MVVNNLSISWKWCMISHRFGTANYNKYPNLPWDWYVLSTTVQFGDIMSQPEFSWKLNYISYNRTVTMVDVLEHPELQWDWIGLSQNIPFKDIRSNPELPWHWDFVSRNKSVTFLDVINNPEYPWNWNILTRILI